MFIIGLGHRRRVGKDLIGSLLFNLFKLETKLKINKESFAHKLKLVCHDLYGWAGVKDPCYYDNYPEEKEKTLPLLGMSPRELWIEFANRVRDTFPTTWRDYILLNQHSCLPQVLIITDLRYPNEADKIQELGGICIKIEREGTPKFDDEADKALENWDKWNYLLENNGDKQVLTKKVKALFTTILGSNLFNKIQGIKFKES